MMVAFASVAGLAHRLQAIADPVGAHAVHHSRHQDGARGDGSHVSH
jgi:hypothetical protein